MFLLVILGVVLAMAFLTAAERRGMGAAQRRIGPNVVGYRGLLQPFADAVKLLLKETLLPTGASGALFLLAPTLLLVLALLPWLWLPVAPGVVLRPSGHGWLLLLALSELGVWGIVYAGWSANSKYPLIGSLRSAAQMLSYSVGMGLCLLCVLLPLGSLDPLEALRWQGPASLAWACLPLVPLLALILLAETNRAPFDLPEAESELVAGFMTEHSAVAFTLFFMAEYLNMVAACTLATALLAGGLSLVGHCLCVTGLLGLAVWVRAALPRVRLDQLLGMGWSNLLPLACAFLLWPLLLPLHA